MRVDFGRARGRVDREQPPMEDAGLADREEHLGGVAGIERVELARSVAAASAGASRLRLRPDPVW